MGQTLCDENGLHFILLGSDFGEFTSSAFSQPFSPIHASSLCASFLGGQRAFIAGLLIGLIIARFVSNYHTYTGSCARRQFSPTRKMTRRAPNKALNVNFRNISQQKSINFKC